MTVPLAEALQQVELEPGRTYRCQVRGHWVELRVLGPNAEPEAPAIPEADIMLDPWIELPPPKGGMRVRTRLGKLPPPDPPRIAYETE